MNGASRGKARAPQAGFSKFIGAVKGLYWDFGLILGLYWGYIGIIKDEAKH